MDDLLSAALSESGLDLSLDDETINHFDQVGGPQDGLPAAFNVRDEPSIKSEPVNSSVTYNHGTGSDINSAGGNKNISILGASSNPSNSQTFGRIFMKPSQAMVIANGSTKSSNPSLDFLLSNKKTIIIKNLPPGITAQALSRGGKLPIKLIQQLTSQKTLGGTSLNILKQAGQNIANTAPSSVLSFPSGSMISVTMGKDGKPVIVRNPNLIATTQQRMVESKPNVVKDLGVFDLTNHVPHPQIGEVSKKSSDRFLISTQVLESHKSTLKLNTNQTPMGSTSNESKNQTARAVLLGSTQGMAAGPGCTIELGVGNPSSTGDDNAKSVTSVNNRYVSTGQTNTFSPIFANSPKPQIAGSKTPTPPPEIVEEDDDEEEAEEELGHTDTYANYVPCKLKIGLPHPDPVVETSSLASVEPPDVLYRVCIPEKTMDMCSLSALQLEAVTYACQQHDSFLRGGERAGFLIGDGAGVGKGRTVAGVIFENYLLGRKRSLWFSVSNDLKFDAQRDLKDIGASNIPVHSLNKFRYIKINSKENGYIRKGVIFATYSALIGESQNKNKYHTRLKQILHWCGKDFDGVIVLDECHKAKNLVPSGSSKPTKTGVTVLELQKQLPKARIIYCSATGASEPRNMAYMSRLGIWGAGTPFPDFMTFIQAVEKRGVGAMEIVAMDMKLRGMYMARQLSFQGVGFSIREIPLSNDFKLMYNRAVKLWCTARDRFQKAANLMSGDPSFSKFMWGQFWSAHQRFFKYLCIAAKVKVAVKSAQEAVKMGKCVVIGLQSTGEARTLDALEEAGGELSDFVSTAKGVFSSLMEKHFPAPNRAKMAGLFGLSFESDAKNETKHTNGKMKRKKGKNSATSQRKKKKRRQAGSDDDIMSDSSHDSEFSDLNSEKLSSSGLSSSEDEEDEPEDDDDEEINPFGDSDSDDDPWLKKGMKKSGKVKKKKKQKTGKGKDREEEHMKNMADSALRALGITPKTLINKPKREDNQSSPMPGFPSATSKTSLPGMDAYGSVSLMKQELLDMLEELGPILPPNTLDELIEELGGPDNVAEMTGRKGRVVSNNDGNVQYESRCEDDVPLEILNLTEKKRFMDGDKYVAIISEAASSGISLQADRRVPNQKRRVHITLEIPWSADRAVQQFGRTHRSNQVSAPEYVFLISELAGERRFASVVAKRLECLGALTHGDRRATESRDLSQFNIDNKYGRIALESVMKSIVGSELPIVEPPRKQFFPDCKQALIGVGLVIINENFGFATLDKDYNSLPKFLNRLLGVEVDLQNELFGYFSDTLAEIISRAKKEGLWDMGILDIISEGQVVKKLETHNFIGSFSTGTATSQLHKVSAERGLKWSLAVDLWSQLKYPDEGFYVSSKARNGKRLAVLVKFSSNLSAAKKGIMHIYRPNLGQQIKTETLTELKQKYKKVVPDDAKADWEHQYSSANSMCTHKFWRGRCTNAEMGLACDIGLRSRTFYILSGSVLSVWSRVERILMAQRGGLDGKMQLIRVKTADNSKLVGMLIPKNCVPAIKRDLSFGATCFSNTFW